MQTSTTPLPTRRESWAAVAYFAVYVATLFVSLESEAVHWLTMVVLPLLIALGFERPRRSARAVLATFGLRREGWWKGVGWAVLLGLAISVLQVTLFGMRTEILAILASGRAAWLYPLTLLLMFLTAGFTEEFFFRGFLQTRIEVLTRSSWAAIAIVSVLFSLYHLPYAYFHWSSAGD